MAPLNLRTMLPLAPSGRLEQRGLRNRNATAQINTFLPEQEMTLQILAITFSAISVASAVLAFYWFFQMRRSFRHHLIMLLIQSDMFKALWFLIYPIVVFTKGPQPSTSAFCQVNGWMVSLGIEASDLAILMIAVHSSLYIFRPVAAAGEGGLYPYRRTAYVLWVVLPVLSASLAFVNGGDKAYETQGTYCYLAARPFWYRLALSWVPRYIIFVIIFAIYAAIYFYVRYKFHGFTRGSPSSSLLSLDQSSIRRMRRFRRSVLPKTPPLAYNGLIPDHSRSNSFSESGAPKISISTLNSEPEHLRGSDLASNGSTAAHIEPQMKNRQEHLESLNGPARSSSSINSALDPSSDGTAVSVTANTSELTDQPIAINDFQPQEEPATEEITSHRPFSIASTLIPRTGSITPFFHRRVRTQGSSPTSGPSRSRSIIGIIAALRHPETTNSPDRSTPELVDDDGQNLAVAEMIKTRYKIRKQLRFLFIYPLVYIAMWLVPMVNHTLQYSDKLAIHPPYALTCATVTFVTLQCAVDCWLFSTRERPWRHMPNNEEGTFWGSFIFWRKAGSTRNSPGSKARIKGPGKSRAEQVAAARLAYKRKEEEMEIWKQKDLERRRMRAKLETQGDQIEMDRHWWDESGFDEVMMSPTVEVGEGMGFGGGGCGAPFPSMSPVAEEADPMEEGIDDSNNDVEMGTGPKSDTEPDAGPDIGPDTIPEDETSEEQQGDATTRITGLDKGPDTIPDDKTSEEQQEDVTTRITEQGPESDSSPERKKNDNDDAGHIDGPK